MFNRNHNTIFLNSMIFLLILLWVYTAGSKLIDFTAYKRAMLNQVFPKKISLILLFAVPLSEFVAIYLLAFKKTQLKGLWLSLMLLLFFSVYISLILLRVFPRIPCSCGGVIKQLGWGQHLIFNFLFIIISITGLIMHSRKEVNDTAPKIEPMAKGSKQQNHR